MHLSALEIAVVAVACMAGALIQGSIGFGLNLVLVPVVALVEPEALPATTLFLAAPMTVSMVAHEHHHVDRRGATWLTIGRVPGSVLGALIVTLLSPDALSALIGAFVILAAAMSVSSPPIPITTSTALAAGFTSGAMGTASSIGGPPVALLYQHQRGPVMRSTLALTFAIGIAVSTIALMVAGEIKGWQVLTALVLSPAIVAGVVLARPLHTVLDRGWLRPAVLVFAALAGVVALLRGLL